MTVPYSVDAVTFQAEPAPGATCRVNRKNLGAGGSDTEFLLTVTAADGKTKQVYTVIVHREEKPVLSGDAYLVSLLPDTGQLDQPFSPERFDYTMTVPYSVDAVTFQAEPAPGATCRVNRKNLGAGGSDTEFLFTVTAADGKTKQVYTVIVHREEKVPVPTQAGTAGEPSPGPTLAPKPAPTVLVEPQEEGQGILAASPPVVASTAAGRKGPVAVIENGREPLVYVLALCFFMVALYLSKPAAKWLCRALGMGKKDGGG